MSTIRMDFLVCSRCGEFWCGDHSPGAVADQRRAAERIGGWRCTRHEDVCDSCLAEAEQAPQ